MKSYLLVAAVLGVVGGVAASSMAAARYSLTVISNSDLTIAAMSSAGIVVNGAGGGPASYDLATGSTASLGAVSGASSSGASGISKDGTYVVGAGFIGRAGAMAVKWNNGVGTILPQSDSNPDHQLYGSRALGVNNSGVVVGEADTQFGTNGVVWRPDGSIQLLDSGGQSSELFEDARAQAINNAGRVAGIARVGDFKHASYWDADGTFHDLGILPGGTVSLAEAINSAGVMVGWSETDNGGNAMVWDGTNTVVLPKLGTNLYGEATGINDAGVIVGYSLADVTFDSTATLWENGQAIDLNTLVDGAAGWTLSMAAGVDDLGRISAAGYGPDGNYYSVVLSPAVSVPEPSVVGVGSLAGLALLTRRRK